MLRKTSLARLFADKSLTVLVFSILLYLYLPIVVLMVFSFNDSRSLTLPLQGFTLEWYRKLAENRDLLAAVRNSFYVAFVATFLTLLIGVPAALALDRLNFPGKTLFRRLVLLPLVLPGIITGISLLSLFKLIGVRLSLEAVIVGHATALLSIVVTQVFARLQRLNRNLEDAAADLGARPLTALLLVVLPNIRSAIIGSGLLSFTLSFDEIPVTFFLTGRDNTLPMYIWSTLRRGITPEVNAVASLIMLASLALAMVSVWFLRSERLTTPAR
jgi:spermidine/putrescine transport system permease protein